MDTGKDNRKNYRTDHDVRFLCTFPETGNCHPIRVLNYSNDGIYFEIFTEIPSGTIVLLYSRGGDFPELVEDSDYRAYNSMAYAKVQWCRKLKGHDASLFGVGAEYVIVW